MNRSLLKKCLSESRLLLLACSLGLYLFCWLRCWVVGQFEMARFQAVLEQFRDFERFSPVPFEQLFTFAGRVALTYDEPVVILCVSVWAISRGSDVVSGELGRGTMEMLLAQPVSRLQVLASQVSVTIAGVGLLCVFAWLGTATGIQTTTVKELGPPPTWQVPGLGLKVPNPLAERGTVEVRLRDKVDVRVFVPAAFNLFCLGYFLAGLSTLMSSWDRYRWRTIGLVVGFYVLQLTMKIAGIASDSMAWLLRLTIFTAYEPEAFVSTAVNRPDEVWSVWIVDSQSRFQDLGPLGYDLILLVLGTLALVAAAVIFCRRDLPAPL
ncbi:MAG: ABC transporter permease [Pirellulaceae bacterium]|nr:ABC transporter permease [Pirellulaceae bacterium]